MAVTKEDVIAMAGELKSVVEQDRWDSALTDAQLEVNPTYWLEKSDLALKLVVAHVLTLSELSKRGQQGIVQDEQVGPVRRSYAVTIPKNGVADFYSQTPYGRRYLELRRQLAFRMMVT